MRLVVAAVLWLVPGCSPKSDLDLDWSKVEALRLPGATLADIKKALGPIDRQVTHKNRTLYCWYPFGGGKTTAPYPWHMLYLTVDDKTGDVVAFDRQKPFFLENGAIYPVGKSAGHRDDKGKWLEGAPPSSDDWDNWDAD
jgi:hypothetical protein